MGISTYELLNLGADMGPFIQVLNGNRDGETINWHINDQSWGLDQAYTQYMVDTVEHLDSIIDLDFELVSDIYYSDIDVNLFDYSGQEYMGLAYLEGDYSYNAWTVLNVVDYSYLGASGNSNKNTFIHEFGHALGLAEPGFDNRWDQDDTAMSYNEGDVGWQTWYTESDLNALISLWGAEDDEVYGQESSTSEIKGSDWNDYMEGGSKDDTIIAKRGSDVLIGNGGDDVLRAGNGRDVITGGSGFDDMYGGFGHNTFTNAQDGYEDWLYFKSDQFAENWLYGKAGNNPTGQKADVIQGLDSYDKIFVQGVETSELSFSQVNNFSLPTGNFSGIGIFANGFLEGLYTGGDLSAAQLQSMTVGIDA